MEKGFNSKALWIQVEFAHYKVNVVLKELGVMPSLVFGKKWGRKVEAWLWISVRNNTHLFSSYAHLGIKVVCKMEMYCENSQFYIWLEK